MAKLGDVCNFYSGTGFPNAYQGDKHGKYPFYKVGDISKNVISGNVELISCDNYINDDVVNLIKGTIIPPQCVVFAKIGEALKLNRRALTSCYCLVDNNVMGVQANNLYLDSRYFYYFMCNVDLQRYSESTAVPSVRKSRIAEIEIPLPSLEEQRHIAAILDKVTDLIAQRRAQLDKLDLLVKSRFVEMFGDPIRNERNWPMVEIGDIAEIRIGPFGSLLHKEDYIKGGHALVNPSHIIDSQICVDENLTVSDEKYAELEPYHLKINDIVLGRRGEMGRCAVVHEEGLLCGTGSLIIRPKKEMKPYFLQSIISNPAYKKIIEDKSVGVTMMNLNVPIVSKLTVPKLPLPLQEQFIGILEKVNELKQPLTNSLQEQEILKNSLMQKYFE